MVRTIISSSPNVFVGRSAELARFDASAEAVRLTLVYGVAGIGKTSFMLRACERLADRRAAALAHVRCRPGDTITTIARSALEQLEPAEDDRPDALDRLIAWVEQTPLVLCVDDAHQLGNGTIEDLVSLASARLPLWICLASREALTVSPRVIDHLVIRLSGLTQEEMRALWSELELLYGPGAASADAVAARGGGNPLLFKHAFAGPLAALPDDPLGLAHLSVLEALVLAELCAFRVPVELPAIVGDRDRIETLGTLGSLARRFLVEVRGATFGVHDLVRETVLHSPIAPGAREHRRAFDHYLEASSLDQVTPATLELLHHALGCGEDDVAARILMAYLSQPSAVLPPPARVDHELGEAFARLATRRPPTLRMQLEALRIRARHGDARAALRELQATTAGDLQGDEPFSAFACGEVAFEAGDLDVAATSLERAVADERLLLPARMWAMVLLCEIGRVLGHAGRVLHLIEQHHGLIAGCGPVCEALADALLSGMAWDYDDPKVCLERNQSAHRNLALSGLTLPSFRLFTALARSARVRLGLPLEPGDALLEPFDEPPLMRALMHILRIIDLTNLGRFGEAHTLVRSILDSPIGTHPSVAPSAAFNACLSRAALESPDAVLPAIDAASDEALRGHRPLHRMRLEALACQLLVVSDQHALALRRGQAALALGESPRGAVAWLRAVLDLARAGSGEPSLPASGIGEVRDADHARCELIALEAALVRGHFAAALAQAQELELACTRSGWRWFACRARLLGAEAAFQSDDFLGALSALAQVESEAHDQGYVNEALHAELLKVALLRARGEARPAEQRVASLHERTLARGDKREAGALGVLLERLRGDTSLLCTSSLMRRLHFDAQASIRVTRTDGVWWLTEAQLARIDRGAARLIVDLLGQQIVVDGTLHDMRRRETLIPLVRALLLAPGTRLSPGELVQQAWGFEYHPLAHRSRLSMAMTRLRKLLGPDLFLGTRDSYALITPRPWMLIEPADSR
jgi:hypothetical protein